MKRQAIHQKADNVRYRDSMGLPYTQKKSYLKVSCYFFLVLALKLLQVILS